jgi:hypothetical protein
MADYDTDNDTDNEDNDIDIDIEHIDQLQTIPSQSNIPIPNQGNYIFNDDVGYLTEEDENNDYDSFNNLSLFLYTVHKNNKALRDYLYDIGFVYKNDMIEGLDEQDFNVIYTLLNEEKKRDMKRNYLYIIRKILHNPNFNLTTVGGNSKKSKKSRKSRKSKKYRKSRKSRKSRKFRKVI